MSNDPYASPPEAPPSEKDDSRPSPSAHARHYVPRSSTPQNTAQRIPLYMAMSVGGIGLVIFIAMTLIPPLLEWFDWRTMLAPISLLIGSIAVGISFKTIEKRAPSVKEWMVFTIPSPMLLLFLELAQEEEFLPALFFLPYTPVLGVAFAIALIATGIYIALRVGQKNDS